MTSQQVTTEPIRPENVIVDQTVTLDAISSYDHDCYTPMKVLVYTVWSCLNIALDGQFSLGVYKSGRKIYFRRVVVRFTA